MTSAIVIGVLVAVGSFIIQEFVRDLIAKIQFRQRLMADIGLLADSFRTWTPPEQISAVEHEEDGFTVNAIWDCATDTTEDIYAHSAHLAPDMFSKVAHLTFTVGKFDEVRRSYNGAIFETLKCERNRRNLWLGVLNSHLSDLSRLSESIRQDGDDIHRALIRRYPVSARTRELEDKLHDD